MPQKPEDLSRIIREMAKKTAYKLGHEIDLVALKRISLIPEPYASEEIISVDLAKLETMIADILSLAHEFTRGSFIGLEAIEKAMIEVKCHYLWFC
jgi:hypothetical protein